MAEFSKLKPPLEDLETQDHGVKIFVADVADTLQDFRDRIIAEVAGRKAKVLENAFPSQK